MKFRFIGDLDCPDWILTQIVEFSNIPVEKFKNWCTQIVDRLKFQHLTWSHEVVLELVTSNSSIEMRTMKAMIAALSFIFEKAAKNACNAADLESEMLQIGFSADHAKQVSFIYEAESSALRRVLANKFIRAPSFEVVKHIPQQINETEVELFRIRSSEGNELNMAIASGQVDLLKKGIREALTSIDHHSIK